MKPIIGSIINDCRDDDARSRQELYFKALFGVQPTFVGVGSKVPDLEAAGVLVDQLDILANASTPSVILVNVAPRGSAVKKQWGNGTPFCYFRVGKTLVVSAFAGRNLDLVHAAGLVQNVALLDPPTVTAAAVGWGELTKAEAEAINHSQFRSLHFLPLVARWLVQDRPVPSKIVQLASKVNAKGAVWYIDNFGNAKTTLTPADIDFQEGQTFMLADGHRAVCYNRLADVPRDTTALTIGSSGYGSSRFVEVIVQWQDGGFHGSNSAEQRHKLDIGSPILQ